MSGTIIRDEAPGDASGVREVLCAAFESDVEAKLVDELRTDCDIVLSLVAVSPEGVVVGYVGFPRLSVDTDYEHVLCIGLAPIAVAPHYQGRGIGRAMIEQGMSVLKQRGEKLVFVLGEPAYYTRFGFEPQAAAAFTSEYAGPYFMAQRLEADAPVSGAVHYPAAFARLG